MRSLRLGSTLLPLALSTLGLAGLGLGLGCDARRDAGRAGDDAGSVPEVGSAEEEEGEGESDALSELSPEQRLAALNLDERSFPLLVWSIDVVRQDYFDKHRFDPRGQLETAGELLGLHTPEFFSELRGEGAKRVLGVTVRDQSRDFPLAEVDDLGAAADLLEQVLVFTAEVLSLEDEPLHELEYVAINGFLSPLDPHTILLTPEESAELGVKTRGSFGGIGAEIVARDRRIWVARVLPGSPAEAAGLLAEDVILKVDEQSTVNLSSSDAQGLLRGPIDSQVVLQIRRGDARKSITITRGLISIPTVIAQMLPDRVGYLQITTFQEDTAQKLREALEGFQAEGELSGLVIDLRGNVGGLLGQAVGILDQFVQGGELVIVRSAAGRESEEATEELALPMSVPVVTLVDENAASASEIVGGSMKHLDRGVILGRSSFGKGTVQELRKATPYGREVALKMTIAEYRVAGDRKIQSIGVIPDLRLIPVELLDFVGVARLYDIERFERRRERARTAHLPSAVHDADIDAEIAIGRRGLSLRYLLGEPPDSSTDSSADSSAGNEDSPWQMRDPEIRLAREVALALVGHEGRRAQLGALPGIVADLKLARAEALRAGIERWKIDWSPVDEPEDRDAPLEVAATIVGDGPRTAGEPFRLHVEVHNPGERTLEQVHLITDCSRDELDGIELLIGRLEPGASESRDVDLQVLPWHPDFVDTLTVAAHVGEPNGVANGEAEVELAVRGAPRPRFSFDYWIIDDPHLAAKGPQRPPHEPWPDEQAFTISGNGDGLLQPGERVLLGFRAHNSSGQAPDARVLLRNLSGRQGLLEEGAFAYGALGSSEGGTTGEGSFVGAFGISISPTADPALPLELELIVGDAVLRESVDDKLRFRIVPGRDAAVLRDHPSRWTARGEDGIRVYNGADGSAPVVAELEAGSVLSITAEVDGWLALDGARGEGRRLWVPKDLFESGGGAITALPKVHRMVDPPVLVELTAGGQTVDGDPEGEGDAGRPGVVSGPSVTIAGLVEHHIRVRDVVVTVRAAGPAQPERKVFYLANRALDGGPAKQLRFSTEVPLAVGSNRVTIVIRDQDKVERRRDLWLFRTE